MEVTLHDTTAKLLLARIESLETQVKELLEDRRDTANSITFWSDELRKYEKKLDEVADWTSQKRWQELLENAETLQEYGKNAGHVIDVMSRFGKVFTKVNYRY